MSELTYDIRVAIEWGEWVDNRAFRHRVNDFPGACGSFEWWGVVQRHWLCTTSPGLPPYRPVPRKPAPARLWECERDGRRLRKRSCPSRLYRWNCGTFEAYDQDGHFWDNVVLCEWHMAEYDWEQETEPGSGVFVSPNGWEDDDA